MLIGSIVTVRTIKDRVEDSNGRLIREMIFTAPKGSMFQILVMGTLKAGERFGVAEYDAKLRELGLMEIPDPVPSPSTAEPDTNV